MSNADICVSKTIVEERTFDDYINTFALAWRNAKAKGSVMANIFLSGVDPDLATWLIMTMQG